MTRMRRSRKAPSSQSLKIQLRRLLTSPPSPLQPRQRRPLLRRERQRNRQRYGYRRQRLSFQDQISNLIKKRLLVYMVNIAINYVVSHAVCIIIDVVDNLKLNNKLIWLKDLLDLS